MSDSFQALVARKEENFSCCYETRTLEDLYDGAATAWRPLAEELDMRKLEALSSHSCRKTSA